MMSWITDSPAIAIYAMLTACLLPVLFAGIAKLYGGFKISDNSHPRLFLNDLSGFPARANAVQQNSYETLPLFLAAVVTSMVFFVPQSVVNTFAYLYVVIRILYGLTYLLNLSFLRSVLWGLSVACSVTLLLITIRVIG